MNRTATIQLGVNIDHVATLRQARYPGDPDTHPVRMSEPDPVLAAHEAELGGADGITVHLREDRRHIIDRDVRLLRNLVKAKFNLEMAPTPEMVRLAIEIKPHTAMLVPEGRHEVTTEGGLDIASQLEDMRATVSKLRGAGVLVSAFIDANEQQVDAAKEAGFDVCEVHTGPYAHAFAAHGGDFRNQPLALALDEVRAAGKRIRAHGMRFNAGHALNYHNVEPIAAIPGIEELHIGHAVVSRAVFVGLRQAVTQMKSLMVRARHGSA